MTTEFKLPELGENIETIQVVKVMVAVGDHVEMDQPVLELETDKATVEVPSTVAGTVSVVHVRDGDDMTVGQAVFAVEEGESAPGTAEPEATPVDSSGENTETPAAAEPAPQPEPTAAAQASAPGNFHLPELGENIETIQVVSVLVKAGDTVSADQAVLELETDKATVEVPSPVSGVVKEVAVSPGTDMKVGDLVFSYEGVAATSPEPASPDVQESPASPERQVSQSPAAARGSLPPSGGLVPAAPSVRRFARELGVDINAVSGSGPHGRVSEDDVKRHAKQLIQGKGPAPAGVGGGIPVPPLPAFEQWGDVRREKMSVIRRKTAEHMALSWSQIPHVTIFDSADITELDDLRKRYTDKAKEAGGRLTMGAMVVKVAAQALSVFPKFNASIDPASNEIIFKDYVHVGVAVDTERGLMVPVIRDTAEKSMIEIAVELVQIADKARSGKITVEEMSGSTFTVTNLGRTCGTHFTPIINYPDVAILGVGRMVKEPAQGGGERKILPLSLSFDHRIIDGSDGVKFLAWIIEALAEPLLLSLEG